MKRLFLALLVCLGVSTAPAMDYHQAYNIVEGLAREVPLKAADNELAAEALKLMKEAAAEMQSKKSPKKEKK